MGGGACATVCASGAMTYAYPAVPELGARVRTLLSNYANAGGRDACVLFHAADTRDTIARLARRGKGLPARTLPIEVHHVASVGLDVWLAALAWGASSVAALVADSLAPQYRDALRFQMRLGETIVNALGYQGEHFRLADTTSAATLENALWQWPPPLAPRIAATFAPTAEKRTTLGLALDHLALHAPVPQTSIPLPAGSPFGGIQVDRDACTMCLACVGACPVGALIDNAVAANDRQSLYFACRALDRVLRSEHYWVAGWFKPSHWIAYWDMFGRPDVKPRYARGAPETWWYDTDKAAKLGG